MEETTIYIQKAITPEVKAALKINCWYIIINQNSFADTYFWDGKKFHANNEKSVREDVYKILLPVTVTTDMVEKVLNYELHLSGSYGAEYISGISEASEAILGLLTNKEEENKKS